MPVTVDVDAGVIGTTADNLACAAHEEEVEGVELYTKSAEVADKEGFPKLHRTFVQLPKLKLATIAASSITLTKAKNGTVWKRDHEIT